MSGTRLASGLVGDIHHSVLHIPHMRTRDERRARQISVFLEVSAQPVYKNDRSPYPRTRTFDEFPVSGLGHDERIARRALRRADSISKDARAAGVVLGTALTYR